MSLDMDEELPTSQSQNEHRQTQEKNGTRRRLKTWVWKDQIKFDDFDGWKSVSLKVEVEKVEGSEQIASSRLDAGDEVKIVKFLSGILGEFTIQNRQKVGQARNFRSRG